MQLQNHTGQMPNNNDAEKSLIATLLALPQTFREVQGIVNADSFYSYQHTRIFQAMTDLFHSSATIDIVSVSNTLTQLEVFIEDQLGGLLYMKKLMRDFPLLPDPAGTARIIATYALARAGMEATGKAYNDFYTKPAHDVLRATVERLAKLGASHAKGDFEFVSTFAHERMEEIDRRRRSGQSVVGIPSGFHDIDKMIGGFQAQKLVIVAARPAQGKTSWALTMAHYMAVKQGLTVGFLSLEMSKEELLDRLCAIEGHIDGEHITNGQMDDQEYERYVEALGRLSLCKLAVDDSFGCTLADLRAKATKLQAEYGLDVLFVDYLQIMSGDNELDANEVKMLSQISRGLKGLARDMNIPVIALAQLSRDLERRASKVPMLSDLRGSGTLEQDADIVAFLYRDDYYNPSSERPGQTDFIVAKNRAGSVGSAGMGFDAPQTRFYPLEVPAYE